MGPGGTLGAGSRWAGALLVTLALLGPPLAQGMEPPGRFLYQERADCYYTNGTERVRFVYRLIYDRQQTSHFDSDVGWFVADAELDRAQVEQWNKDAAGMATTRAEVDRFCRHNYRAVEPFSVERREAQSDSARSKMLTGVGGFVLGLIFLVPGLVVYLRNKKGRPIPQPAGLLN